VLSIPSAAGAQNTANKVKALEETVEVLLAKIAALESRLAFVSVVNGPINGLAGPHLILTGVNVHIRSGAGRTDDGTDSGFMDAIPGAELTGLGNLVIGYNEELTPGNRGGSHNLILGRFNRFSSFGGLVAGEDNMISAEFASVSGGDGNTASGPLASICGGSNNQATGQFSSVSGGILNTASGQFSSVSGGINRTAPGDNNWAAGALLETD
jgi:hypothetical protein